MVEPDGEGVEMAEGREGLGEGREAAVVSDEDPEGGEGADEGWEGARRKEISLDIELL